MIELRIHGRGGQGAVLASEMFVDTLLREGKHAASFPFFGFERRGAPVVAFLRFDQKPILQKDQIYRPDCLVVMDNTLFKAVDVFQGIKSGGILVLNESRDPSALSLPPQIQKLGLVDATRISMETINTFIPNTAMLAALCKTTGWAGYGSLKKAVSESMDRRILKNNLIILERAFRETRIYERRGEGAWK
ncbi:MAG: hypothetical protein CVU57_23225 [Deltaproteobacteria bacterium HGW-Deltaproteobacteria-15]|jgi:2-oxoacid:acceptor oxidoreductase gamma subunit (pyruvate/2-ketoisovalerate family)|nr:MAG: hypothetical protein CVU57_23225 [Deltaproteobacteria bacterium HGW-Deltaproteobacteria-15]